MLFFKMYKNVLFGEMYIFVHLENVSMNVGSVHLGKMFNFVHLGEMVLTFKTYTIFATIMLVM